jgi:hypothetical protein
MGVTKSGDGKCFRWLNHDRKHDLSFCPSAARSNARGGEFQVSYDLPNTTRSNSEFVRLASWL